MPTVSKLDSNFLGGLRYCEEASLGTLPGSPVWYGLEPNSYNDFGGQLTLLERRLINDSRQRKKGAITDLDANGGFNHDLVQDALQDIMQGFFFANLRRKAEFGNGSGVFTAVDGTNEEYEAASGLGVFLVGDLVLATGFGTTANNGLKRVTASAAGAIGVAENLTAEGSPPAAAKLTAVGFQFASGDLTMTVSGGFPVLGATTKNLTQLGVIPGEWIYIGDDSNAAYSFATAACNGFARVRSVTASAITLDKTQFTAVTDAGTSKTIRIFVGRVLKNETGSSIVRRTYQIERKLGVPDTSNPSNYQSEYLVGAVANTCQFNIAQANKVNVDMAFVGTDFEQRTATEGLKSGDRPAISEEDAFNTSSDFSRIKLSLVSDSSSAPSPLFAYVTDITLSINNNVSPNKAVGVLGAFDMTAGIFEVGGNLTAYFATVEAVQAVRDNEDVTIDCHMVKENSGISIDMPLIALGNGRLDVVQDQAVTLPLDLQAATAAKVHPNLNHTMLVVYWSYLPDAAE
jgi:hypothetical protein